jgi:hypothetical protein
MPSSADSITRWYQLSIELKKNTLPVMASATGVGCWQLCSSALSRLPSALNVLLRQMICSAPHVAPASVLRRSAMSTQPSFPSPNRL